MTVDCRQGPGARLRPQPGLNGMNNGARQGNFLLILALDWGQAR